jgi:hypothetical protein
MAKIEQAGGENVANILYKGGIGVMSFLWRDRYAIVEALNSLNEIYNT